MAGTIARVEVGQKPELPRAVSLEGKDNNCELREVAWFALSKGKLVEKVAGLLWA